MCFCLVVTFRHNFVRIRVVYRNAIKPDKIMCMVSLDTYIFTDIICRVLLRLNKEIIVLGGTVTLRSGAPSDMNEVTHVEVRMYKNFDWSLDSPCAVF